MARVDARVVTHGDQGVVVQRRGDGEVRVPAVRTDRVADPTGVGDAFRAGFLAALSWGLPDERCAQVGCMIATLVLETVGTQEYHLGRADFLERFARVYGEAAAADVEPHLKTLRP